MVEKETVGVRLAEDKIEQIEKLAKEKNITKSDATRRLIDKGIELKKSPIDTLVTGDENSQTEEGKETVTDGGIMSEMNQIQNQIEEQSSLMEKREEQYKQQINMVLSLAMAIGTLIPWTISYLETGINSSVTLVISVVALVALVYSSYQVVSYVQ